MPMYIERVKFPTIRQWSEIRGRYVVDLKMIYGGPQHFTFDAWIVETGRHVGVHSPHPHRPYFHLQTRKSKAQTAKYEELPSFKPLRHYAQVFERAVRKEFGINAWKVFS